MILKTLILVLLNTMNIGNTTEIKQGGKVLIEPLSIQILERFISENNVQNIDQLIPLLPSGHRNSFILMHSSQSAQGSSGKNPRAILFGETGKFVISFTDKSHKNGNVLEVMQYDDKNQRFDFYELKEKSKGGFKLSDRNPTKCLVCHTGDPRPNWENYAIWNNAFGENENGFKNIYKSEKRTYLSEFFNEGGPYNHPRYRHLNLTDTNPLELQFKKRERGEDLPTTFKNKKIKEKDYRFFYQRMATQNILFSEQVAAYNLSRVGRILNSKAPYLIPLLVAVGSNCFKHTAQKDEYKLIDEYPKYIYDENWENNLKTDLANKLKLIQYSDKIDYFLGGLFKKILEQETKNKIREGVVKKFHPRLKKKNPEKWEQKLLLKINDRYNNRKYKFDKKTQEAIRELAIHKTISTYIKDYKKHSQNKKQAIISEINSFFPENILHPSDHLFEEESDGSWSKPTTMDGPLNTMLNGRSSEQYAGLSYNGDAVFITAYKKFNQDGNIGIPIEALFTTFNLDLTVPIHRTSPISHQYGFNFPSPGKERLFWREGYFSNLQILGEKRTYGDVIKQEGPSAQKKICSELKEISKKIMQGFQKKSKDLAIFCETPDQFAQISSFVENVSESIPPIPKLCLKCHSENFPPKVEMDTFIKHLSEHNGHWAKKLIIAITTDPDNHASKVKSMPYQKGHYTSIELDNYKKNDKEIFLMYLIKKVSLYDPKMDWNKYSKNTSSVAQALFIRDVTENF